MIKFIEGHGDKLRSLIGLNIDKVWTVHKAQNGEFWADCPIIIGVEGKQLEFCSFKDNKIAVTWDEIDLGEKLDWYGNQELNLEWRRNAIENIAHIIGKAIRKIEVIEMPQDAFDSKDNKLCSNHLLNGLGFDTGKGYLSIYNSFDETGLSFSRNENLLYSQV
jgi:hypothetical protein